MSPSVLRLLIPSQLLWATGLLFCPETWLCFFIAIIWPNFLWRFKQVTFHTSSTSLILDHHSSLALQVHWHHVWSNFLWSLLFTSQLLFTIGRLFCRGLRSFPSELTSDFLCFLTHYLLSRPSRTCVPTYWAHSVPLNHQAVFLSRAPVPSLQSLHLKTDFLHICSFPLDFSFDECRPIVYPKKNCTRYMSMFKGVGLFPPLMGQDIFFGLFGGSSLDVFLRFSAGFLSHHFSLLLGFQCDSIYMFRHLHLCSALMHLLV